MKISKIDLPYIVAASSSVRERATGAYIPAAGADPSRAAARLAKWRHDLARDDESFFRNRLHWDNLDEQGIVEILDQVRLAEPARLPRWARILPAVSREARVLAAREKPDRRRSTPRDQASQLAMEDYYDAHRIVARRALLARLHRRRLVVSGRINPGLMAPAAVAQLEQELVARLSEAGMPTLYAEFQQFKSAHVPEATSTQTTNPRVRYDAFRQQLYRDGFIELYEKYPVLARLHATLISSWVVATCSLLVRLQCDRERLAARFGGLVTGCTPRRRRSLGPVISVQPGLSQPFQGGQSVCALRFRCGLSVIYKPKSIGAERALSSLLQWFNQHGAPTSLQPLTVLDRGQYGWVERIEASSMTSRDQVERFYYRAGALLVVCHLLGTTDCHGGNLFACGEQPRLIDAETVCQSEPRPFGRGSDTGESPQVTETDLARSIIRTHWVPSRFFHIDRPVIRDCSALGSVEPQPCRIAQWKHVNSDEMCLDWQDSLLPPADNVPRLHGETLSPFENLPAVTRGFQEMYRYLSSQRTRLLGSASPLDLFADTDVRFVMRNGDLYSSVMNRALTPEALQNGADRSIALDLLARAYIVSPGKPHSWPLLQAEVQSLEELDVPYFRVRAGSTALQVGNHLVEDFFQQPGSLEVKERLAGFNEQDLAIQVHLLHATFHSKWLRQSPEEPLPSQDAAPPTVASFAKEGGRTAPTGSRTGHTASPRPLPLDSDIPTPGELCDAAGELAAMLRRLALRGACRTREWISVNGFDTSAGHQPGGALDQERGCRGRMGFMDRSMAAGQAGVALFLAAADFVHATTRHREVVDGVIGTIRRHGISMGTSSTRYSLTSGHVIYALCRIARLIDDDKPLALALDLARSIHDDVIRADTAFDVARGSAGGILNLLALYESVGEPWLLDRAITCGEHLREHAIAADGGNSVGWPSTNETGVAHGCTGIGMALIRLFRATGQDRFRILAQRAAASRCAHRRGSDAGPLTGPGSRSRTDAARAAEASWCHGAPGVGLARIASFDLLGGTHARQEIERAASTTLAHLTSGPENLCCGVFGRTEFLMACAGFLNRSTLRRRALQGVGQVILRAQSLGGYQCDWRLPRGSATQGFFQGHAGIGYHLLRLAFPQKLPCVLLWE